MPNVINKVVYNGNTLIDISSDTVTSDKLYKGITAHSANGTSITGTAEVTVSNEIIVMPIGFITVIE